MTLALLVLDCDGIILESVAAKREAYKRMAAPFGPEAVRRMVAFFTENGGVSRYRQLTWLYREFAGRTPDSEELEALSRQYSAMCLEQVLAAPLVPGVLDVLESWRGRVPIYVCSGSPVEELHLELEQRGIAGYFTDIIGAPPPKEKSLARIVRETAVDRRTVVMVGDSPSDLNAAKYAGTLFYGRGERFAGSGYPWAKDLTELNAWLKQLYLSPRTTP